MPGGVDAPLSAEARDRILSTIPEALAATQRAIEWYTTTLVRFEADAATFGDFPSAFMALVDADGNVDHYDGWLRVMDAQGHLLADRIAVMYGGRIVETGPVAEVLERPVHPYTAGLIGSVPSRNRRGAPLAQIRGHAPSLATMPPGCPFHPRCDRASAICARTMPPAAGYGPSHEAACHHPLTLPQAA